MQYWKQLELSNFDTIVAKTNEFIKTKTSHLDKTTFTGPFTVWDDQAFNKFVPELTLSLREHGLFYEHANLYVMWDNRDALPHKDYTGAIARLNIPILNCQGTYTLFYENLKSRRLVLPNGNPFYVTTNKDYIEVTRIEMLKPAVCRISEGHSVIMDETRRPRIMLTIATVPDTGLLLDN